MVCSNKLLSEWRNGETYITYIYVDAFGAISTFTIYCLLGRVVYTNVYYYKYLHLKPYTTIYYHISYTTDIHISNILPLSYIIKFDVLLLLRTTNTYYCNIFYYYILLYTHTTYYNCTILTYYTYTYILLPCTLLLNTYPYTYYITIHIHSTTIYSTIIYIYPYYYFIFRYFNHYLTVQYGV